MNVNFALLMTSCSLVLKQKKKGGKTSVLIVVHKSMNVSLEPFYSESDAALPLFTFFYYYNYNSSVSPRSRAFML